MITTYTNGRVIDANGERQVDVSVDSVTGRIVDATNVDGPIETVDVSGCVISPGFVDLVTHLREPGNEAAETVASGARAAAAGGYTAIVAMPDTNPCLDSASTLAMVRAAAMAVDCEIVPAGAVSVDRAGRELAAIGELAALGVSLFTDCGHGVQDPQFLRRAMEYARSIDPSLVIMQRGALAAMAEGAVMHEGAWSVRLGLGGQPALAEELLIQRDLALSALTGARVHVGVSTAGSVELIRTAKASGTPVTAHVTPHHLALTDASCAGFDPVFRVEPPLRTRADADALRAGLADGTIDAIATHHEPHPPDAKERPFDQAPPGVIGLETAFAVSLASSGLGLADLLAKLSWQPAAIAGIADRHGGPIQVGYPANLTIFDPEQSWRIDAHAFESYATNSPFVGQQRKGKVRQTVFEGRPVFQGRPAFEGQAEVLA